MDGGRQSGRDRVARARHSFLSCVHLRSFFHVFEGMECVIRWSQDVVLRATDLEPDLTSGSWLVPGVLVSGRRWSPEWDHVISEVLWKSEVALFSP